MAEGITYLLTKIWLGLSNIPLFDLGISITQFYLGIMIVLLSVVIFKWMFGAGSPIGISRSSRNVRKSRKEE